MLKRLSLIMMVALFLLPALSYAMARDDVRIEKGDQCGFWGGQKVYITNDGEQPVKATIKVIEHYQQASVYYLKKLVEPGESLYLGCDEFGQDNSGSHGTIEYYITGAYYVE
jgi:hypothetical protein